MRAPTQLALAAALLLAGVCVFADPAAVAVGGLIATVLLLFAIGVLDGRLGAVAWALVLIFSAVIADVLWQVDWEPFNRSDDYEAIPQTPFVAVGIPIPMAVVAAGVAVAALRRRLRRRRDP